jgi:hypothetical protein
MKIEMQTMGCLEFVNGVQRPWMLKYPFSYTDSGRADSKRPQQKNDCTVRALANVARIEYDEAYDFVKSRGRKSHRGGNFPQARSNDTALGLTFIWRSFPAVKGRPRMNPATFCGQFKTGRYIVRVAKHVFAIVDGIAYDTLPERPDRCIYGAWEVH